MLYDSLVYSIALIYRFSFCIFFYLASLKTLLMYVFFCKKKKIYIFPSHFLVSGGIKKFYVHNGIVLGFFLGFETDYLFIVQNR